MNNRPQTDVDFALRLLITASDEQVDKSIRQRLEPLIGLWPDAVAARMKRIIQDCESGSLASNFVLDVMRGIYRESSSRGLLSINI